MQVGKIQSSSESKVDSELILQTRLHLLLCCYWTALVCVAILQNRKTG